MRKLTLGLALFLGWGASLMAQGGDIDVTTLRANPKTQLFNDGKHTVNGYIYAQLEKVTSCCGNDDLYMEVTYNEEGCVTNVRALSGKYDCYKKSVADIIRSIRWEAEGVKGTKTTYFGVRPVVPCSGSPTENTYKAIANINPNCGGSGNAPSNNTVTNTVREEEIPEEETEEVVENVKEEVNNTVKEEETEESIDEAAGDEEGSVETVASTPNNRLDVKEDNNNRLNVKEEFLSEGDTETQPQKNPANTTPSKQVGGGSTIPPQEKREYVSVGERNPDPSHKETHANLDPGGVNQVRYSEGDSRLALMIKQELRKTGYCGFAQAAVELTVDPSGNVVESRIMYANNDKVASAIPAILKGIKMQPKNVRYNYYSIVQFKTEIICGNKGTLDLDKYPDVITK